MPQSIDAYLDGFEVSSAGNSRPLTDTERAIARSAITGYLQKIGIGVPDDTPFKVGDIVKWRSSNINKMGEIVGIIPARARPSDHGFKLPDTGSPRDHMTFVVKGQRVDGQGKPFGTSSLYWPLVSLLKRHTLA